MDNPAASTRKRQRKADGGSSLSCAGVATSSEHEQSSIASESLCLLWSTCRLPFVSYCRLLHLKLQADSMMIPGLQAMVANAHQYRDILHHSCVHLCSSPVKEFVTKFAGGLPLAPRRPQHISPPSKDEVDFVVHIPNFIVGDPAWLVDGPPKQIGNVIASVRVFPWGIRNWHGKCISLYIVIKPAEDVGHIHWEFSLRYSIRVCPWEPDRECLLKRDQHTFTGVPSGGDILNDRGWHDFFAPREQVFQYCRNGFLFVRGSVSPI